MDSCVVLDIYIEMNYFFKFVKAIDEVICYSFKLQVVKKSDQLFFEICKSYKRSDVLFFEIASCKKSD